MISITDCQSNIVKAKSSVKILRVMPNSRAFMDSHLSHMQAKVGMESLPKRGIRVNGLER